MDNAAYALSRHAGTDADRERHEKSAKAEGSPLEDPDCRTDQPRRRRAGGPLTKPPAFATGSDQASAGTVSAQASTAARIASSA